MDWASVRRETARSRSGISIWTQPKAATKFFWSDSSVEGEWSWWDARSAPEPSVKAMTPDPARPKAIEVNIESVAVGLEAEWGRGELERLKAPAANTWGPTTWGKPG